MLEFVFYHKLKLIKVKFLKLVVQRNEKISLSRHTICGVDLFGFHAAVHGTST